MNPRQFNYLTAERTGWYRWTRKRRRKFQKRWLRQHGHPFRWFVATWTYIPLQRDTTEVYENMIFFKRESCN